METLPLIDVSSEDDLLISASSNAGPDPPSPDLSENHNEYKTVSFEEGMSLVKMSKQMERLADLSESPEQKQVNSRKYNLRKSLAWDSAFFTSEGVLNPEELAIVSSTFVKAEASPLPGIPEDVRKSAESTSTLDSDPMALESLEVELFENVRASIQKSLGNYEDASIVIDSCKIKEHGEINASVLGSSKKVELFSQNKKKPLVGMKRHVVSKKLSGHTSEFPHIVKVATNKSADSKPSLKPPRVLSRATLPTALNKTGFVPGNILPRSGNGKPSPGNLINRRSVIVPNKINGDSSNATSNSVRSSKATSSSRLCNPVFSRTTLSSHSGSLSSSFESMSKSPSDTTRKTVASRIMSHSSPGSTTKKTLENASKIKTMSSNASNPPIHPKSTFKFSANVSPNSSLDSVASESSSSSSVTMKPGILRNSLNTGSLSSFPALAGPESTIFHSSGLQKLSTGHPYVGSENSAAIPHSQCFGQDSSEICAISEPSIGDNPKRCTNSNSGAKSIKPSGLRKPTPKIGYFDAEKSLVRNVEMFSQPDKLRNIIRRTAGSSSPVGVNKPKPSKLQLIRPAAKHASTKFGPTNIQLTSPSSTHNMKPASPKCLQQLSKPSELGGTITMAENNDLCSDVSKDLHPFATEESHSNVAKVANGVVDAAEFGQSPPSVGEQVCQEHSELVTAFPIGNVSMISNGNGGDNLKSYEHPSCGYIEESHMVSDLHSVIRSIEKENLFPADKTDFRIKDLQVKNLKLSMVECIEEKVSSLSLS